MKMKRYLMGLVVLGVVLAACTGGDTAADVTVIDENAGGSAAMDDSTEPEEADRESIGSGTDAAALAGRKIIRQASLVLRDDDPERVFQRIVALVEGAGGFVAASELSRTGDEEPPRIDVTVRVPSGDLSATIATVSDLAEEVLSRQLGSTDVTARYVDNEARLRNLRTLETELLALLTEVRDVADPEANDLLLVFDRLQSVRLEIEQLTGAQQAIDDQVDLATLTVTIVPTPAEVEITDDSWDPMRQVRESLASLVRVLENLANLAIWAGLFLVPVLAILAVPVGLVWWLAVRRRKSSPERVETPDRRGSDEGAAPSDPIEGEGPVDEERSEEQQSDGT